MERLSNTRPPIGFTCRGLRLWGLLLTLAGIVGRGILQTHILKLGSLNGQEVLALLDSSGTNMTIATVSLILQMLETCAVPVFAWLLVKGAQHTSDLRKYMLRVGALAVICEIPYDMAMKGKFLDLSAQNPVFGLLLSLVVLMLFRTYGDKKPRNILIRMVVVAAGLLWASMLRVDNGMCFVLVVSALWLTRTKPTMQNLFGAGATMLCSMFNIFFMISPMIFLGMHFCNGEQGDQNRAINYLAYPLMLLTAGVCGMFLL